MTDGYANKKRTAKEGEKSEKKEKRKSTLSSLTNAVLSPIFKKRKDKDRLKHSNSEARLGNSSLEPEIQKSASSADVVVSLIHSEDFLPEQYKGKDMSLSSGGIPQIQITDGKQKSMLCKNSSATKFINPQINATWWPKKFSLPSEVIAPRFRGSLRFVFCLRVACSKLITSCSTIWFPSVLPL